MEWFVVQRLESNFETWWGWNNAVSSFNISKQRKIRDNRTQESNFAMAAKKFSNWFEIHSSHFAILPYSPITMIAFLRQNLHILFNNSSMRLVYVCVFFPFQKLHVIPISGP